MESATSVEQSASVAIYARDGAPDLDLDVLTEILGIHPSAVQRRGDVSKFTGRVHDRSVWSWRLDSRIEVDAEAMIEEVLATFEPIAEALSRARSGSSLDLTLGLVIKMYGTIELEEYGPWAAVSTPALSLSTSTVNRLAVLGFALDIDQYVIAPR